MPGAVVKRKGCSTWAVRLYVGKSQDCLSGYKWISGFRSKQEAEEYQEQNAVLPMYGSGRGRSARGTDRFRTYAERWLKTKGQGADKLRPKTLDTYQGLLKKHVLPETGWIPLSKLDKHRMKELLNRMEEKGLSGTTQQHVFRLLHKMLRDAVADELVLKSPCEFKAPRRSTKPAQVWTEEQTRTFLAEVKRSELLYYPLFLTVVSTGMRQGEILGLQWPRVDLDRGVALVVEASQRLGKQWALTDVKTERSRRTVPLSLAVVAELKALRKRQAEARLQSGGLCPKGADCREATCPKWHDVNLVFAQANGKPLHGLNISRRVFPRILKRAGLPRIRFHVFGRHAYGSYLNRQGVDMATISSLLGHSGLDVTMKVYIHEMPAAKAEAGRIIGEVLAGGT